MEADDERGGTTLLVRVDVSVCIVLFLQLAKYKIKIERKQIELCQMAVAQYAL